MSEVDDTDDIGGSGYSLDELSDYLDRGRTPAIPEIDENPACQAMLGSLERVASLSRELIDADAAANPDIDETWLGSLLTTIGREVRAGRDIPLSASDPLTRLSITEGAVRELVRAAGDSVDGVLVGSCSIEGDVTDPESAVTIAVTISVVLSAPIAGLAQLVRERIHTQLLRHTELTVESIDVTVTDVHVVTERTEDDA